MIALKKEVFDKIDKKELMDVVIFFVLALILFKIVFFKEALVVLFKFVLSLFWMFVLPGYFIMLYWKDKIDFVERLIVGVALSAAVTGVLSYYIGLAGLNLKYHFVLIPSILILTGFLLNLRKNNTSG